MAEPTAQGILDKVLEDLKSNNALRQLGGLQEMGRIKISSDAIVRQLEKLALGENESVRSAALDALDLETSQFVLSKDSMIQKNLRMIIVEEIETWCEDGLLEPHRGEVLKRRYDYDSRKSIKTKAPEVPVKVSTEKPFKGTESIPVKPVAAPAKRQSLTQTLLSETSIKIYLYLGAFFVIAAAVILAALVEEARLPTLLISTLAFAGGAVGLRKRLPQPSFALSIVFSCLLPIDANVIANSLSLSGRANGLYWMFVFLAMAVIWALGTLFYASRLFSAAAFLSLILAAIRVGEVLDTSTSWDIFFVVLANLLGLMTLFALKKRKDNRFILPVFLLAQLTQYSLVIIFSLISSVGAFELIDRNWIAATLNWILTAFFFAASNLLIPFPLFPWMAAASLYPLPWLVLSGIGASQPVAVTGFTLWAALAVLASEIIFRSQHEVWRKYHFPLLGLSVPLLGTALLIGFNESALVGFLVYLATAVMYTLVNILRARWYVWVTALTAGIGAYFTFFSLPFMDNVDVYSGYKLLGASLLLLLPELFSTHPIIFTRSWNWPPTVLGALITLLNLFAFIDGDKNQFANISICLGIYTLLFAGYALHFKKPAIGYLATTSAPLTLVYALQHFELPALAGLAVIYYSAGYFLFRREGIRPWGKMLVTSGLALGALVSCLAVFTLEPYGGGYILGIATLFAIEMFTRRNGYLEIIIEILLSFVLVSLMNDFKVKPAAYYLFGISLLWLTSDAILQQTFSNRKMGFVTKIFGGLLTLTAAVYIYNTLEPAAITLCFTAYTLFFALYAWLYKNPLLGYASTLSLALTIYSATGALGMTQWLIPVTGLSTLYFATGFFLRRAKKAKGWDSTLLFSGLGLASFVSLLAPSAAGGLEKAVSIAIAATFFAAEAFARKNVWLGFPANGFYLISYFVLLNELDVNQPQFYSVGTAALGLLQHYLLRRAGQKTAAFLVGIISQLLLLGTSYIQMVSTGQVEYFVLLFLQFLAMLAYGIIVRSRSLIIAPIAIVVLATLTILYNALKNLSLVIIIGITGILLLGLGILAVVMRERITNLAERFNDWDA